MNKKIPSLLFIGFVLLTAASCGGGGGTSVDNTKTQLYVGFYDAGLGRDWIKLCSANFEEAYKDYSFQEGKTGVQVIIDYDKAGLGGDQLKGTIAGKKQSVFITENIEYYSYVSSNKLRNIDNVLLQKDSVYQDELTIAEKMDDNLNEYLTMLDGHYYALPYYDGLMGFQYDIDLFEKKNLYFKMQDDKKPISANALSETFDPSDYFVESLDDERSYGPDGKTGVIDGIDYSNDDGLPSTFNEFYALQKQMLSENIVSLAWCTNYLVYLIDEMVSLVADIEGKDQFNLNYTWNGKANNLVQSVGSNGKVTFMPETAITPANANMLQKSVGRYKALEFAKNIVSNSKFYLEDMGMTHKDAQKAFINTGNWFSKDIGMLCDGSWWENEGSANFSTTKESESRLGRKFGLMPFPKYDIDEWEKRSGSTYFSENQSLMFINANVAPDMVDCSERFLRFLEADSQLSIFTQTTSMTRPFKYSMTSEDLAKTSYYGNQMYQLRNRITSDACNDSLVYYYPMNVTVAKNENTVHKNTWYFSTLSGDTNPMIVFSSSTKTVEDYFNGLYAKYSSWSPNL